MTNTVEISQGRAGRLAGVGYLVIFVLAFFANFFVLSRLIAPGNPSLTAENIMGAEGLFRSGIASFLVVLLCDLAVGWALFVLFRPVSRSLSILATMFRMAYTVIHGGSLLMLVFALRLLGGGEWLGAFETNQVHTLALMFLDGHNYGFVIALTFFGVHLAVLGYLIIKSGYLPKALGVLLILSAFGYVFDTFANIMLPNYADYADIFLAIVAVPSIISEFWLCLWLLLGKVKIERAGQD